MTIEAGVVVKFGVTTYSGSVDNPRAAEHKYRLIVNGTLDLRGTPTENVVFTSAYDDEYGGDSNNDGTATTPSHYDWGYIQINNSTTELHDCLIRYGGYRDDDTSHTALTGTTTKCGFPIVRPSSVTVEHGANTALHYKALRRTTAARRFWETPRIGRSRLWEAALGIRHRPFLATR